jgi:hypothetical protein
MSNAYRSLSEMSRDEMRAEFDNLQAQVAMLEDVLEKIQDHLDGECHMPRVWADEVLAKLAQMRSQDEGVK